ncbi:fimbria/pilus outer membrane usher protein [Enterobacter asburiae]|uniref:fimbria/pilus outer membrane usher protein n=1 Tax=Enterobacter asburiae TaxID=61645 RepID=UPI00200477A2|nr:fimbria/pilus outer membrane usher protein [Enterobacter asburiae]MCK6678578.1 fimbria/pilus outer membrane usher protein [Enterobacter asburiae]
MIISVRRIRKGMPVRSALSLAVFAAITLPTMVKAADTASDNDSIQFDVQAMKARGVDPKLADMFAHAPRFMPGVTPVKLTINGAERGKVTARFDDNGQLCADPDFLKKAGIGIPENYDKGSDCFDLKTIWPSAVVTLDPGEAAVVLVVPQQAIVSSTDPSVGNWTHDGTAGVLNYDAQYMSSSNTDYAQIDSEAGFNVRDWIFRSRQNFSRFNGENVSQHSAAYAQKTLAERKQVLQTGQISLSNFMFGTGQVWGAQIFPETALQNSKRGAGLVQGIADSQSVVEVRQSGALVYSTTVPAGPFKLDGFSLLNTRTDLDVTLTGQNGDKRQFTVPATTFLRNGPAITPGFSFGAGKLDQQGSDTSPVVGTAATGWLLNERTTVNAGILGSNLYKAIASSLDMQPSAGTQLSTQLTGAQDTHHNETGISLATSLSQQLTERVGVSLNLTQQTKGYRELSDAVQNDPLDMQDNIRNQYGLGVNWSQETLGNLSASWSRSTSFNSENSNYLSGSWSRQIMKAYLSVSVESNTGNDNGDNRLYANIIIPFGSRSVSSYYNNSNSGARVGVRYSDRSSQDRGWSISSDKDFRNNSTTYGASMDGVTPYSQLSGSVSQESGVDTTWSGRASGSIVAHNHGVTVSPYRVGDTFGIAKVGDQGGVRIETPAGPTWTDGRGYAVIPSISGYRKSTIEVDTRSLDKNIDIANSWQETEAARGSVSYVNFDVVRTRRVLVSLKDASGKPIQHGSSVFDNKGNFVTIAGDNGAVFIPDIQENMQYDVQSSGVTQCRFSPKLPSKAAPNELYETANAICN